jgi:hypothetical protein
MGEIPHFIPQFEILKGESVPGGTPFENRKMLAALAVM